MDWILPLIGGLGLGAVIKSIIDFFLNKNTARQKIRYTEMRDAYLGLLDALHKAAIEPSDKASKDFALWHIRVQLFGSENVSNAVQGMIDTNSSPKDERDHFYKKMISEMTKDLQSKSA
ncbi:hypothetical protein [Undibacterium sp. RuTC16W]|uniref:hypothetical protein n=1 Tax=Undibacterium sp. RuTC16W TaxID=3413048 RepID=UPI003BF1A67E